MTGPAPSGFRQEQLGQALGSDRAQTLRSHDGVAYVRLADDVAGLPRGTVVVGGRLIPTYPSIGRIFALEAGIRRNFTGPFWAEEKVDGYNVRVARVGGRQLAFTRGGHLCPFTTDRLPDLADLRPLFDAEPDLVLCAEVAGPMNPYIQVATPHAVGDVGLFVFDLMRLDRRGFVPLEERDALLSRHGIPTAPVVGRFRPEDAGRLREVVLGLDARQVEGIIFKPPEEGLRVKYVTPSVNLSDMVEDASLLAELPGNFFTGRILRLVMGIEELGLQDRLWEMERRLGRALLEDFEQTLTSLRRTGVVSKEFRVRVRSSGTIDALVLHMNRASRSVQVHELERHRAGDHWEAVFRKTFLHSTSYLKTLMSGDPIVD